MHSGNHKIKSFDYYADRIRSGKSVTISWDINSDGIDSRTLKEIDLIKLVIKYVDSIDSGTINDLPETIEELYSEHEVRDVYVRVVGHG